MLRALTHKGKPHHTDARQLKVCFVSVGRHTAHLPCLFESLTELVLIYINPNISSRNWKQRQSFNKREAKPVLQRSMQYSSYVIKHGYNVRQHPHITLITKRNWDKKRMDNNSQTTETYDQTRRVSKALKTDEYRFRLHKGSEHGKEWKDRWLKADR